MSESTQLRYVLFIFVGLALTAMVLLLWSLLSRLVFADSDFIIVKTG